MTAILTPGTLSSFILSARVWVTWSSPLRLEVTCCMCCSTSAEDNAVFCAATDWVKQQTRVTSANRSETSIRMESSSPTHYHAHGRGWGGYRASVLRSKSPSCHRRRGRRAAVQEDYSAGDRRRA